MRPDLICEFAPGAGPLDVIGDDAHLVLDGTDDTGAATPDHASLDIIGDIDIRVEARLDDWFARAPSADPDEPAEIVFLSKWQLAGSARSYAFTMFNGFLNFVWSTDGTLAGVEGLFAASTDPVPFTSGRHAVRVTFDADNGVGDKAATFYTADTIAGPWTQLSQHITLGTSSIHSGTSPLRLGRQGQPAGTTPEAGFPLEGQIYAAEVRDGIDGVVVADPDFTAQAAGATSFVDSTGKTWSLDGAAEIVKHDWVDLTGRLLDAPWSIGRDDEFGEFPPGEATIVLSNDDRELDPDHAGGQWFGKLLPRVPFRLRSDDGVTVVDEFYGFVEGGWEQALQPPEMADVTVKLVDQLAVQGGHVLPDVFDHAVLSLEPVGHWRLDEASVSEQVADRSGNGHDATVAGEVNFGATPIRAGHPPSAEIASTFDAATQEGRFGHLVVSRSPLIDDTFDSSVVATFASTAVARADAFRTLFVQATGGFPRNKAAQLAVNDLGQIFYSVEMAGGGFTRAWADPVTSTGGHIVFAQQTGIAVDAAALDSTLDSAESAAVSNGVGIGGFTDHWFEDNWHGRIGAVSLFSRDLFLGERQAILDGFELLRGESSGAHINWALDRLGVPPELRAIAAGSVIMGPAITEGTDALDWIREVAATEQGSLFVDHRDGGKITFRDRYHRHLSARSTVSQATFTDDPAAPTGAVRVERGGLDIAPNGIDSVVNQVSVRWRDGEVTVSDDSSIDRFGVRQRQVDTQATTAAQARSVGEWIVARYAEPRSLVRGFTINPAAATAGFTPAIGLQVDDRVTFRLHPQQVGTAIETDLFVEGVTHRAGPGLEWTTSYRTSPVETFVPWIWGTSTWDQTTAWG